MVTLLYIILAAFLVSMGSLIGIFTLSLKTERLSKILLLFVSLSAGAFLGGAFFHLLPEASIYFEPELLFSLVLAAFIVFFLIEKILHWRHCHQGGSCDIHTFGYMNLIGDSIHNLIDGFILAAAFLTSVPLGIVTMIAIALHEIPQEISDFGVLLYAGFSKKKALVLNFLVALMVVVGSVVGYFLSFITESFVPFLLPVAAGGFLYIAASDLMPEIRKESNLKKSMVSFGVFLLGVLIMFSLTLLGVD